MSGASIISYTHKASKSRYGAHKIHASVLKGNFQANNINEKCVIDINNEKIISRMNVFPKILSIGFTEEDKAMAGKLLEKMSENAVQYMK